MRVVFFGNPEASIPTLRSLSSSEHEVAGVVTFPDRARGRGMKPAPSPVRSLAENLGLPILTVTTLQNEDVVEQLRQFAADAFVVAAFGLILRPETLSIPSRGCLNVHLSLLPALRGAAPAEWAIINGSDETGVTIMMMDEGLDTGPILDQLAVKIEGDETGGQLLERLSVLGGEMLVDVLGRLDEIDPVQQDDSKSSYAPMIRTADAEIDWHEPAVVIERKIRGFDPRPGAWTMLDGKRLKVFESTVSDDPAPAPGGLELTDTEMIVGCGAGSLSLGSVQVEGKSRTPVPEFLRGARLATGTKLGS
jgi:methionyl-tRNA formyltransferase